MLTRLRASALMLPLLAACGGGSDPGGTGPDTDTQAPTVNITAPAAGATVSGNVVVQATASDNKAVSGVQLRLDGAPLGAEDLASPYSAAWSTSGSANGAHTLTAVARDASGNTSTSAAVEVTVSNLPPPPPGSITVTTTTSGDGTDADGYVITVDGTARGAIGVNASVSVAPVSAGAHSVAIKGVAPFCERADQVDQLVNVPSGGSAAASFAVECVAAPSGRIAYLVYSTTTAPSLRIAQADGSGDELLVNDVASFDWSPDGTQIGFVRHGTNLVSTLHRIDADGTNEIALADLPSFASGIRWGPSGMLVFSAIREGPSGANLLDLYLIDSDGANLRPLAALAKGRQTPVFSPDGSRVAYSFSGVGEEVRLGIMNVDGSSPVELTSGFRDAAYDWSHDGTRLLFRRQSIDFSPTKVFAIGVDGSGAQQLVEDGHWNFAPAWSPDDQWIAYRSERPSPEPTLVLIRADGTFATPASWMMRGDDPRWKP